jgi:prepilin-type N-terminal cleavage/methylation domain-containing protein
MSTPDSRGFTLIEAIAALAIIGAASIAGLESVGSELRTAERARTAVTVSTLAQDRLAAITLLPLVDLQPIADSISHGTFPSPFDGYEWTASVRPVLGERNLYDVTVEVFNRATRYDLATRLYRAPLGGLP